MEKLNFRQQEKSHLMENVIFVELIRRGYSVDVGVVGMWVSFRFCLRKRDG